MIKTELHWVFMAIIFFGLLAYMTYPFVDVFVYGLFIYYISRPLYKSLNKKVTDRSVCALITLILLMLPFIFLSLYTLGIASIEAIKLLSVTGLARPETLTEVTTFLNFADIPIDVGLSSLITLFREHEVTWKFGISVAVAMADILMKLFLSIAIAFFLLRDGRKIRTWTLDHIFIKEKDLSRDFFQEVDKEISHVFFGSMMIMAITAMIAAALFSTLNYYAPSSNFEIPYPVLLGILCGFLSLIPAIGLKFVWVPLGAYLAIQSVSHGNWWFTIAFLISVNVLVDFFPDNILRPIISKRRIHVGLLMFAYIFGISVFGFSGLFIGPIVVVIATNMVKYILPKIRII